jgi:hypothetical protein
MTGDIAWVSTCEDVVASVRRICKIDTAHAFIQKRLDDFDIAVLDSFNEWRRTGVI